MEFVEMMTDDAFRLADRFPLDRSGKRPSFFFTGCSSTRF